MRNLGRSLIGLALLAGASLLVTNAADEKVTVTAYFGGQAKKTYEKSVRFVAGDTAMSATLRAARVETNAERTFIKSIEGVGNSDAHKEYWLYFVNGEAMHVGAAETNVKPGDRVLWFLRRESSTKHERQGTGSRQQGVEKKLPGAHTGPALQEKR